MTKIQYVGTSDVVTLEAGEDWGGRLSKPLAQDVVFSHENNHTVDSEELKMTKDTVALILEDTGRFRDVSDLDVVPPSPSQRMWYGVGVEPDAAPVPAEGQPVSTQLVGPPSDEPQATKASRNQ